MGTPLAAPSARLVSGQGAHLFGARRAAGARRRGHLSPSWSRIQFDDSADNLSFGGNQPMTASGDRTNALARELNVAALGIDMTV